ncbi:unnamed protein product [Kuraishia capsulata CBS 1993]|uniref:Prenyltransferase alpha-alpha toroid domain-containing protein n=1 Tax=Kuraishia capsulata CBS 1993 TaxID=1382522 RepID=W6MKJ1_9ASCO|nr:uncharacterized protein KUCA_T00001204001 [Kuraishia capsulata CBS 1993]CDK25237.1 unnamed protein product [Kuraishia capsulata CBS 1993]
MSEILKEKHVKFFRRCINMWPEAYEAHDSNKMAIVYFSLAGLDVLGALHKEKGDDGYEKYEIERREAIDWVYSHLVPSGSGFRGSFTYDLGTQDESGSYDPPNLAATGFALQILLTLRDESMKERLDKEKIMGFVKSCQQSDGQFCPIVDVDGQPFGDTDLRYCMIAATIRKILKYQSGGASDINIEMLSKFTLSTMGCDGGMASTALTLGESHAGLTFCGLNTLALLGKLDLEDKRWDDTVDWLVHRQISADMAVDSLDAGGFNGRENKRADTCYVFWVLGSLVVLGNKEVLIDVESAKVFLLDHMQDTLLGGFAKGHGETPDPYHSFLGLAALSILKAKGLQSVDVELVITKGAKEFYETAI